VPSAEILNTRPKAHLLPSPDSTPGDPSLREHGPSHQAADTGSRATFSWEGAGAAGAWQKPDGRKGAKGSDHRSTPAQDVGKRFFFTVSSLSFRFPPDLPLRSKKMTSIQNTYKISSFFLSGFLFFLLFIYLSTYLLSRHIYLKLNKFCS
jgi:hypothetical protein